MTTAFRPPGRLLLGPGPSEIAPSVLCAMSQPTLGHLDPACLALMDEIGVLLRRVLDTLSPHAFLVSGTGSAGMELVLSNLAEPGDAVLVGVSGYFGARMAEVARRAGAEVVEVAGTWGRALGAGDFRRAAAGRRFAVIAAVHGETSTGVVQDVGALRAVADECGALLAVDAVTTLANVPFAMDAWGVDAVYSCTQKGLACPSGLSPVALSPRAFEKLRARRAPLSFYLDARLLDDCWRGSRAYHHTISSNLLYGAHEALRLVLEEGLAARWARVEREARALWRDLALLGVECLVPEPERLFPLTAALVPQGADDAAVRRALLEGYGIEIGAGFGPLKGRIWRLGLMGHGATARNRVLLGAALAGALARPPARLTGR